MSEANINTLILVLIYTVVVSLFYFIPSFVAFRRRHPNRWAILGINVVFGATGLGWIGSLIWACGAVHLSPTGSNGGESGLNIFVNDPVTVTHVAAPNPEQDLRRLNRLRSEGVISDEEHATMRKPLVEAIRADVFR